MKIQANCLWATGNAAQCRTELALSLNSNTSSFSSANIHLFTWGQESQKERYLKSSRGDKKKKTKEPKQTKIWGRVSFPGVPEEAWQAFPDRQTLFSWGWQMFLPFSPFSPFGPLCPWRPGGPIGPGSPEGMRWPSLPLRMTGPRTGTGQSKEDQFRMMHGLRSWRCHLHCAEAVTLGSPVLSVPVDTVLLPGHYRAWEGKNSKSYLWVQDNPSLPFHQVAPGWYHMLEREMKKRMNEWLKPLAKGSVLTERSSELCWKDISLG